MPISNFTCYRIKIQFSGPKIRFQGTGTIMEPFKARMNEYIDECLEKDQSSGTAWITSIKLLPSKRQNQTCYLMTKGETRDLRTGRS